MGLEGAIATAQHQLNGVGITSTSCHFWFTRWGEVPCNAIPETFIYLKLKLKDTGLKLD